MQTNISEKFKNNPEIKDAEKILRACVHCGFCTATCPTYQLLGDELDGPRGRIYLIKQLLEGKEVTRKTQMHLDRCLTCRSCETTCPSGVRYGRLVDIGREIIEQQVTRSFGDKLQRAFLRKIVSRPSRFEPLIKMGDLARPFLPYKLKVKLPTLARIKREKAKPQTRKMLVLQGCVQSSLTPQTNQSAMRVLEKLGIELFDAAKAGCCGAVSHHMSAAEEGRAFMRRNIDAWWPHIEQGAEAIIVTASGCGAVVKEYGELLKHDSQYATKAQRVSELAKDIGEVLRDEDYTTRRLREEGPKVAFHSPCTLQHGQKLNGVVESILGSLGYRLTQVSDAHLCCGSAGTYSILQSDLSQQLLDNKLAALQNEQPDLIATANVGCQMHLASKAGVPVIHWIELVEQALE